MPVHTSLDGDNGALRGKRDRRPVAAVDDGRRRVEEQVHDAAVVDVLASRHTGDEFGKLRADARKGCNGRKQRIEDGGAHGRQNAMEFDRFAR